MARGLRPLFWRSGLMCPGKQVGEIKVHRVYSTQEQSPHHPEQASLYIHVRITLCFCLIEFINVIS